MHFFLVFMAIFAVSQATVEDNPITQWNLFKRLHEKTYPTMEEESYR